MKNKLKWGKLRGLYNQIKHNERLQNAILLLSFLGLMIVILLYLVICL